MTEKVKPRTRNRPYRRKERRNRQEKISKERILTFWPLLIFILGLGIILYPTVSNYYMFRHQSKAIVDYSDNISVLDDETIAALWAEAIEYNRLLYLAQLGEEIPEGSLNRYDEILNVTDDGMLGYISIPSVKLYLPIYHGTSDRVLQKGVGHWELSSIPVGGANVHSVLTGHNGLPSARLFTDLERVVVGDTFVLNILGETMTYEVYDIETVLPYEIENIVVSEGKDLCTLATCTPYGVNSHRLLVHGRRTENAPEEEVSIAQAAEKNAFTPMLRMIVIAVLCVLVLLILLFVRPDKKKKRKKKESGSR